MSFSTPLFADPGTAATQGLDFWETVIAGSGAGVGSDSLNFRNNARSLKVGAGGQVRSGAGTAPSNGRLTFRVLIPAAPGTAQVLGGLNSAGTSSMLFAVTLNSSLQSEFLDSSTRHAGGRTFTTGTWVRFTLAWNLTSTTNFTVKGWSQVDGESSSTLEWTFTNANFTLTDNAVPSCIQFGATAFSTLTVYFSDIFSDSDSSLTDVGDIQLTPKLPNANVVSNNAFDTAIGTNAANRWENVNNRPLDLALGWKQSGSSQVNEFYGIEGAASGDTDVSTKTIVGYGSWVYAHQKPQPGALVFANNSSLKASGTSISVVGVFINGAVAGDLIVVVVSDQIGTALTISDACATPHTWVQAKQTTSTVRQTVWWTIYNGTTPSGSGGGATVSFGSSSAARAITGLRFAGVIAASPVDANPAATTDGTNTYQGPSTGTLTQADEIVLALFSWAGPYTDATALDTAGWNTVSGNSTIVGADGTNGGGATSNVKHLVAWKLPGATTSLSTIAHNNTANRAGVQTILSFKLPGGIGSASLRINGSDANIADTLSTLVSVAANPNYVDTTNSLSQSFATSAIYPSTSGVIGLKSSGTDADTSLYECGVIVFYAPSSLTAYELSCASGSFAISGVTSGIRASRLISGLSGSYATSGVASGVFVGRKIITSPGSYLVSGDSTIFQATRLLTSLAGIYAVSGKPTNTVYGRFISAGPGTYSATGNPITALLSRLILAAPGVYDVVGKSANTLFGRIVSVAPGSYSVSGKAVNAIFGRVVSVDPGSYGVIGDTTEIVASRLLAVDSGVYSVTGRSAQVFADRMLSTGPGTYSVIGDPTLVLVARMLSTGVGIYLLTGVEATLFYQHNAANNYELIASSGSFLVSGIDALLLADKLLSGAPGIYSFTGKSAGLLSGRKLSTLPGSYNVLGKSSNVVSGRILSTLSGAYVVTGKLVNTGVGRLLSALPGAYATTGKPAGAFATRTLTAPAGTYTVAGKAAQALSGRIVEALAGSYQLTGADAALLADRLITLLAEAYEIVGNSAKLTFSGELIITRLAFSHEALNAAIMSGENLTETSLTDSELTAAVLLNENLAEASLSGSELGAGLEFSGEIVQ